MVDIQYIGENLMPGQIGRAAIVLGFVASIFSAVAYFFATQNRRNEKEADRWILMGRSGFLLHAVSVFAVIGIIIFLMINKHYEYQYVQAHVSDDLSFRYVFVAFWEGQEGSFLLWMFWHIILGLILLVSAKKWEAPTLSVLALIQAFIGSMLLGLYISEEIKVGSNPLLLLRDSMNLPIFNNADYVQLISGTGLNPLLQNYWMTIHPPTLFLGFASTAIPFCYAIAGLWTGEHKAWLKPALRWSLFSAGILGTGILMGGAWAYEALNFGGYWAWDPVENASLVPWLILVAGVHTNLIANATGYSIRTTYLFYVLTFFFILYSTFLTRSGILGETSVHAFTEMGLETQLGLLVAFFLLLGVGMIAIKNKSIPTIKKEEAVSSKEFWMFIGTLVLLFSSILITGSTSLPIYNEIRQLFDPIFEGVVINEPVPHYNKYQLWIAIFIGFLSGVAQFLRFREQRFGKWQARFWKHLAITSVLTAGITFLFTLWINATAWQYILMLAAGVFTIVANIDYLIAFAKGNMKQAGSVISHVGFGVMLIGILASSLNKTPLSANPFAMKGLPLTDDMIQKNVYLLKGEVMPIKQNYEVTYVRDTFDQFVRTFEINFKQKNEAGEVVQNFNVYPNVQYNKEFTDIAALNPDTKHYWNKDIFTHVVTLPKAELDQEYARQIEDSLNYQRYNLPVGESFTIYDTIQVRNLDTAVVRSYPARMLAIDRNPEHPDYHEEAGDLRVGAVMEVYTPDTVYQVRPMLALRGQMLFSYPEQIGDLTMKVKLDESIFDEVIFIEKNLEYESVRMKQGETVQFGDYTLQFGGFNRSPEHPEYKKEEGDIAVGAYLGLSKGGKSYAVNPIYFIRENRPFNIKETIPETGSHIRFNSIDPKTESAEFLLAQQSDLSAQVAVDIATDATRTDFIVFEAIEFQGINLFWIGTIAMMLGFFFSLVVRWRAKTKLSRPARAAKSKPVPAYFADE
ncbi:MAG: cytochrome c biogenesis protein CcsA [Bacteroidota bacterium]